MFILDMIKGLWKLSYQQQIPEIIFLALNFTEILQQYSLYFPNHGWEYFMYKEYFLLNSKKLANFFIFEFYENQQTMTLSVTLQSLFLIIVFSYLLYLILLKYITDSLINKLNTIYCILFRILKIPLLNVIFKTLNSAYKSIAITLLFLLLIISLIKTYFQRQFSRKPNNLSLYNQFSILNFLLIILDIIIIYLYNLDTSTAYDIFIVVMIIRNIVKSLTINKSIYQIALQSIQISHCGMGIILFIFIKSNISEYQLFFTIILICPLLHTLSMINLQQYDQNMLIKLQEININDQLKQLEYSFSEDQLLQCMIYYYSNGLYYKSLQIYLQFKNKARFSFFYSCYLEYLIEQIAISIQQQNKETIKMKELQDHQGLYKQSLKLILKILCMQQGYYTDLLYSMGDIYEMEHKLIEISKQIVKLKQFLIKNNIFKNCQHIYHLRLSYCYYAYIIQDQYNALLYKDRIIKLQHQFQSNFDIKLIKNKALLLEIDIFKNIGEIYNYSNQINKFFNLHPDIHLLNVKELMLPAIKQNHDQIVLNYLNHPHKTQKAYNVQAIQYDSFIQQLSLSLSLGSDLSNLHMMGLFVKTNKTKITYIVFNQYGIIQGISKNLFNYFIIPQTQITQIYIQSLCLDIFSLISKSECEMNLALNYREHSSKIHSEMVKLGNYNLEESGDFYQDEVEKIIKSSLFKFWAKLQKYYFEDEILQYTLELMPQDYTKENKSESLSIQELSIDSDKVSKDHMYINTSQLLNQLIRNQENQILNIIQDHSIGHNLKQLIKISICYAICMVFGMAMIFYSLGQDSQVMNQYVTYLETPILINQIYSRATTYLILSQLQNELNYSEYLQSELHFQQEYLYNSVITTLPIQKDNLQKIESEGYSTSIHIHIINETKVDQSYSELILEISQHLYSIAKEQQDSVIFIRSSFYFLQNYIEIQNLTNVLVNSFSSFIVDFIEQVKMKWLIVTVLGIFALVFPKLIVFYYFYEQENYQKILLQIQGRITIENLYQIIELKEEQLKILQPSIQEQFSNKHRICQDRVSVISISKCQLFTTQENTQNNQQIHNKYVYDKLGNKKLRFKNKIYLSIFQYIFVVLVFIMGNQLYVINCDEYSRIQDLYSSYINFNIQLSDIITLALLLKTQEAYQKRILIESNYTLDLQEYPQYFSKQFQDKKWKPCNLLSNIIQQSAIEQDKQQILINLYSQSFCLYVSEMIPFCSDSQTYIEENYGEFSEFDNNKFAIDNGIIGFIGELELFINSEYIYELDTKLFYNLQNETNLLAKFNNLIIQYNLNIEDGFNYFLQILTKVLFDVVRFHQFSMQLYCILTMGGYIIVYLSIQFILIYQAYQRQIYSRIALCVIPRDYVADKHIAFSMKQITRK